MKVIELSEDVGVKNIKSFYLELKNVLESDESEIILDFSEVRRVDLSLIQVIMAADRELKRQGKKITLKYISGDIKEQLYLTRLLNYN